MSGAVKEQLTEEVEKFTTEEQALAYFADQKKAYIEKVERRTAVIAEAKRHDAKDPNIPIDLEVIEHYKAVIRGYDDAIAGATKRAAAQRDLVKKTAAPAARGA